MWALLAPLFSAFLLLAVRVQVCLCLEAEAPPQRRPRAVNDVAVVEAATWALGELKQLSDSGIYETLYLESIDDASTSDGVFHYNTFLSVQLGSPHFKSGLKLEPFEIMVMHHRNENLTSFAINEFPVMNEDAVEEFWIAKVEERRHKRERFLSELEAEAEALERCNTEHDDCSPMQLSSYMAELSLADLEELDTAQLFMIFSDESETAIRRNTAQKLVKQRLQSMDAMRQETDLL